jgi:hypothetical protein
MARRSRSGKRPTQNRRDPGANLRLPQLLDNGWSLGSTVSRSPSSNQKQTDWLGMPSLSYQAPRPRTFTVRPLSGNPTRQASRPWSGYTSQHSIGSPNEPKTICTRREERREIIHATGNAGKVGQNKPKFTLTSTVRCK